MNDNIWQEEVRKERCSSPSIEDENMDEGGGQPEAADEDKQPKGGDVEHEAMQETSGAEESQLLLTAVSEPDRCSCDPHARALGPLRSCCTARCCAGRDRGRPWWYSRGRHPALGRGRGAGAGH